MKILIVDDNAEKIGQIVNRIKTIPGLTMDDIRYVSTLHEARHELRTILYDLLILDLYIPDRIDGAPSADIGIAFIEEICSSSSYNIPLDIVALTAYKDAKNEFSSKKELTGFTILEYDQTNINWEEYLVSRIQYLLQCNQQRKIVKKPPECDVLWLTAVSVETEALKELYTWERYRIDNDVLTYYTTVQKCGDKDVNIIHVQLPDMGIASAAATTAKGITYFDPQYVIMTGIAAGIHKDVKDPGDVMISDNVWNYDSGKYIESVDQDGRKVITLNSDGKMLNVQMALVEELKQFSSVEQKKKKNKVGVFACGSAVIASETKIKVDITPHARQTIAVDMESYGVLFAAKMTTNPEVPAVIIKGNSDKGNSDKGDDYQKLAADNSALVAKDLIDTLFQNRDN